MRCRLIVAISVMAAGLAFGPGAVWATTGGGAGESGADRQAGGELLGDGAEVWAEEGLDLGPVDQPRTGGGNVDCVWIGLDREADLPMTAEDWDWLRNPPESMVGTQMQLMRRCADDNGIYSRVETVTVTLPIPGPPGIDPAELAMMARSQLPLPLPVARMSPAGEQTVNLATWLWLENWEAQSRSASAGGVTATVTATPVEQRWVFGRPGEEAVCHDAGMPYDLSRPAAEQSTLCSYTFRRSSAAEPDGAYRVEVTLRWRVTWTSNIGASGDLGFVSRTASFPLAVAEHQALNDGVPGR